MALGKRGYNRQRRIRAGKQSNPFLQGKLPSLSNLRGLNLIFFFFQENGHFLYNPSIACGSNKLPL